MPEYLAPGVYAEEVSTGPVPIEGVSTSTTGLVGPTPRGPLRPRLITSWLEFQLWYGGLSELGAASAFATWAGDGFPYTLWAARGFFDNGGQRLFMARVCGTQDPANQPKAATLVLDGSTKLTIASVGPADLKNQIFIRVAASTQRDPTPGNSKNPDPNRVRISVAFYDTAPPMPGNALVDPLVPGNLSDPNRREPTILEDFDNLLAGDIEVTLQGSRLITGTFETGKPSALPKQLTFTPLQQGAYGAALQNADYTGEGVLALDQRSGLAGLATIDEVSLLCIPNEATDLSGELKDALRIQCESLKDRFAILQVTEANPDPGNIFPPFASSYVAIYYPWIRVVDPGSGATLLIPQAGHVAGIYAATDEARGVHKAPANVEVAGILVNDLPGDQKPLQYTVSKGDQEILNPLGINVIRDFRASGLGCRVWGARTLSSDAQWRYINVRRLFIFVEQSVIRGTQWVVFEPNDEMTWARVRRSISDFLTGVWQSGALVGATPDEAFFVRCDNTTMTQDDIDNGRLICLIGMAPAKPAEFVIFRFSQITGQPTS